MTQQIPVHIADWCLSEGYTDPFVHEGRWWAFSPNGVMAVQIRFPSSTLSFINFAIVVDLSALQQTFEQANQRLEQLNNVHLPTANEFTRNLIYANASSRRSLTELGIQPLVIDDLLGDQLSEAIRTARAGIETFGFAAVKILAEQIATAIPTVPSALEASEDPAEKAIELLVARYRMKRAIARLRMTEFCDRHNLSDQTVYSLLREGKIRVKHGFLSCGTGFPHKRKQRDNEVVNRQ